MVSLAEALGRAQGAILERWTDEAERAASSRGLSRPELQSILPTYLAALGTAPIEELGEFTGRRRALIENHLSSRLRQGFDLSEIVDELSLLARCVIEAWRAASGDGDPPPAEAERLYREMAAASVAITDLFHAHLLEEEQHDKRYVRLLEEISRDALRPGTASYRERLTDSLAVIMEAMGAQSVALLLHDVATGELVTAASVGAGGEAVERYATSLDPRSFPGQIASSEEPTEVLDAATTELELPASLRHSGIHSLLGVRLPVRLRLVGVLYIGLAQTRRFSAAELRRLETLGERLSLHLDTAKLYTDLIDQVADLQAERALRERFVAVLAHDLRGPLSTARLRAQLLAASPGAPGAPARAGEIVAAIDRTDRMIRDLLDVSRLRAGERLPLQISRCDLGELARQVAAELATLHGDRFVVEAEADVGGYWSADELSRALWNLATNAIKYGAADAPVTIGVRRRAGGVALSVHNRGAPLAPDEQRRLFEPFARGRGVAGAPAPGWGLGLTLVRGCAEAHGGSVRVDSGAGGTTFTIELPLDARPARDLPAAPHAGADEPGR